MKGVETLRHLGERRILQEIIPQYATGTGDDCAILKDLRGHVVVTTDPVPPPAAQVIGGDPDPYWMGWLLVTINASDIAASGGTPIAFLASLEMPPTLLVSDLHRLLAGIRDSCAANGLPYVGGNLREAERLGGVGTGVGVSETYPLTRKGAGPGDLLLSIGEGGRFWADVERIRLGLELHRYSSPVFAPVAQTQSMQALHKAGLVASAMDSSDGLAPSLVELSRVNFLGLRIFLDEMASAHEGLCERPERFWMGWGDWTVLAVIRQENLVSALELLQSLGTQSNIIGEFTEEFSGVLLKSQFSEIPISRLESERFAIDSWFSKGVDEYHKLLHSFPLPN